MDSIKKYERLLPRIERDNLERMLEMEAGYVLDFSDRTFFEFCYETIGIDPEYQAEPFSGRGPSKAKRLRAFIENGESNVVGKLLREMWTYREALSSASQLESEDNARELYFSAIARIEGRSDAIDASAIKAFEPGETLEELVAAIRRDLDAKRPQAAMDRLHTYCMKRFASLVRKHGGGECGKDDALHARVGRYVRLLREKHELTPLTERIIKSSISVFEGLNPIRNDRSFAHDTENLVEMDEARFIFDTIAAFLRFSKAVDGRHFED